ncbi:MAG: cadherin-like domain-containing protein [Halioglobus sp.]|nr:cadherin-like domain-containing protein [Halioglobus sp.]
MDTGTTPVEVFGGSAPDTPVANIVVDDPNSNDKFDIELTDASDGAFKIVGNQLQVRDTDALDAKDPHTISIVARDLEDQSVSLSNFAIDIIPNERPTTSDSSVSAGNAPTYTFMESDFPFSDADIGDSFQAVEIPTTPAEGDLFVDDNDNGSLDPGELIQVNVRDVVTVDEISNGRMKYVAIGSFTGSETFAFAVGEGKAFSQPATMTVNDVDADESPVAVDDDFAMTEGNGLVGNLLDDNGNGADSDAEGSPLSVSFAEDADGGDLVIDGSTANILPSGAELILDASGVLTYNASGELLSGDTLTDTFTYRVTDGTSTGAPASVTIEVTGANNAPTITTNAGLTVIEGLAETIGPDALSADDPDDGATGLVYTLVTLPGNGNLELSGSALAQGDTFTQADIENGRIRYRHDGSSTTSDALGLELSDGGEDGAGTANATFAIAVLSDSDDDGLPDGQDPNPDNTDTDGDGIPDGADVDVDGDGTPDNGTDTDGDGINDTGDVDQSGGTDTDGDGIDDANDPIDNDADADNDGLPDAVDPDSNNPDTDGDGIPDGADVDADGDGTPDNGTDTDGDGINDTADTDTAGGSDADGDGINDANDPIDDNADADNDGLPDAVDPDSNNPDADGDGIPDGADVDADGDGTPDNGTDTDGDGINDTADTDTDGRQRLRRRRHQ